MKKSISIILSLVMCLALLLTACGEPAASTDTPATDAPAGETTETTETTKTVDTDFANMTWEEVLAEAEGQTVTWYLWGGSIETNDFIDNVVGAEAEKYGVTINRVGVNNITEAVNITIGEKQAGKDTDGTVDLYWINGSNFMMMQQAGVTFENWSESLPNSQYVDWTDPSIANDMGLPVNGQESPWMSAQLQLIYDSERISADELPQNYAELLEWAKANPGRFTYLAPPAFMGTRFIKGAMYEMTGGYEQYNVEGITQEDLAEDLVPVFDYLKELEPYLWREGSTYPQSPSDLETMFNNNEVDFSFTMNGMGIQGAIDTGAIPPTSQVYCMETAIADTNYVATSYNSANKAGAMVIANILLDPAIQAQNIASTGGAPVVDFTTLSEEQIAAFDEATATLGEGTYVSNEEKAATRAPEVSSSLNPFIEALWQEEIGQAG